IILDDDGKAHTTVSTDLQAFGLIVTAEPYFAVTQPSNLVVVENVIGKDTVGWAQPINAKFEALQRGDYTVDIPATQLPSITANPKTPLELLEAENAVAIARAAGAEKYAPETLQKAEEFLAKGRDYLNRKQSLQAIGTVARGATQQAEDARLLTIRRKEEERLAAERAAQQQRTEEARARAEAATQQAAQESARAEQAQQERLAAEQARAQAEQAQRQAQAEAQRAQQERQQAEAARQAALQQQQQLAAEAQRAQMTAQQAQQARLQTEQQAEQQREHLLNQLNSVLQTMETARGLIVNMSDVLFDLNKATLKPGAKIRLAKVAGILMAYPDLHLQIEGFTDNTGTAAYNQQLSERRAAAVRDYLISQGVPVSSIVAQGYGEADPVASNSTPEGRQLNRRVDMVVSGQAIGVNQTSGPGNSGAVQAVGSSGGVSGTAATGATNQPGAGVAAGTTGGGASGGAGASVNTPVGSGSVGGNTGAPVSTQPATPPAPPQK
ncbi:MAG TPA: OmpA family protein, partial [Terriglobales bacterium]|nr:OmpA family protein [Terriglobales bacterium]